MACPLLQCCEHFADVPIDLHAREDMVYPAIRPYDVGGADDAHGWTAIHILLLPDTISFKGLMAWIGKQRKIELVLIAEFLQGFHAVCTHTCHAGARFFQFFFSITELVRLAGSAGRIGLRKEIKDERFCEQVL